MGDLLAPALSVSRRTGALGGDTGSLLGGGEGRYGLLSADSALPAGFFSQRTAAIASSASLSQHIINTWKPFKYRNLS